MDQELPSIRRQLALLAKRKSAQTLGFPRDWRPSEVTNPEDGQPFTPRGAWIFIANLLEQRSEVQLETVTLDNPPGSTAYVLTPLVGEHIVYIKVQLGAGKIIGRSFHYSHE